jgi:hypothetical protein
MAWRVRTFIHLNDAPAFYPRWMPSSRGILTMAYGGRRYRDQAVTLARSLDRWSPGIPRAVITDASDRRLRGLYDQCIALDPSRGPKLAHKLWLPDYSPFEETLFIDADCLVVRNLEFLWELFGGLAVGAVGEDHARDGHWFGDVARRCDRFGLDSMPAFNGGLYYFRRSAETDLVFADARRLASSYEELGFARLRNGSIADEPLLSVAMARSPHAAMVHDDGRAMRTPLGIRGRLHVDVLHGVGRFVKRDRTVEPAIIHFCSYWTRRFEYRRERLKLTLTARGVPGASASSLVDRPAATARTVVRGLRRAASPLKHTIGRAG